MPGLFILRLIGLTAGTLVYLFLLVLILGHRRPRGLERLLFFLALALFLVYSGALLEVNAEMQPGRSSHLTIILYSVLISVGLAFLPGLVVHTHFRYLAFISSEPDPRSFIIMITKVFYLAPILGARWRPVSVLGNSPTVSSLLSKFGATGVDALFFAAIVCAGIDSAIWKRSRTRIEARFFKLICGITIAGAGLLAMQGTIKQFLGLEGTGAETATVVLGVLPGAFFIYFALRHNFLEYGRQRNLIYALSASALALLYLALVRRVSVWLEPALPPEATSAILLFALIFLFEPLQRAIGPVMHRAFREKIGKWQQISAELQAEARQGDASGFVGFVERRVREEFGLAAVRLRVPRIPNEKPLAGDGGLGHAVQVPLRKDGKEIGLLEAASTGSFLTGETSAALEFLGEQLPAMLDMCQLIEEKLRLERELAGRERLALLGQMAASVSHNLRNPLSSMKTIMQVQLEHPNLPLDVRHDSELVVQEIDRMGEKLKQLLNFAKPSVNGQLIAAVALARQTAALFARDAERRNLRLEFDGPAEEISVLASEDALGEVLSNLIVNAIEAQPAGGRVRVGLSLVEMAGEGGRLELRVEDDGPGISQELRAKIFQPYFTTKATGTGLGLSIVARRVDEMGGAISCESPVRDGKGTRFRLTLPLAAEKGRGGDENDSPRG